MDGLTGRGGAGIKGGGGHVSRIFFFAGECGGRRARKNITIYYMNCDILYQSFFSQASAVVGVHGPALSHLVMCRPGTPVLEIGFFAQVLHVLTSRYLSLLLRLVMCRPGTPVLEIGFFLCAGGL